MKQEPRTDLKQIPQIEHLFQLDSIFEPKFLNLILSPQIRPPFPVCVRVVSLKEKGIRILQGWSIFVEEDDEAPKVGSLFWR